MHGPLRVSLSLIALVFLSCARQRENVARDQRSASGSLPSGSAVLGDAGAVGSQLSDASGVAPVRVAPAIAIGSPCSAESVPLPECAQGGCAPSAAVDVRCEVRGHPLYLQSIQGSERVGAFLSGWSAVVTTDPRGTLQTHGVPVAFATPFMRVEAERGGQLWLSATSGTIPATLSTVTLAGDQWTSRVVSVYPRAGWVRGLLWPDASSAIPQFYLQIPYEELIRFDPPARDGDPWTEAARIALRAFVPQLASDRSLLTYGWTTSSTASATLARWSSQTPEAQGYSSITASRHDEAPRWLAPTGQRSESLVLLQAEDGLELVAINGDRVTPRGRWESRDARSSRASEPVPCGDRARAAPPRPFVRVVRESFSLVGEPSGRAWVVFERQSGDEQRSIEQRCQQSSPGEQNVSDPCRCFAQVRAEVRAREVVVVEVSGTPRERWVHSVEGGYGPVSFAGAFAGTSSLIVVLPLFVRDNRRGHRILWLDRARL